MVQNCAGYIRLRSQRWIPYDIHVRKSCHAQRITDAPDAGAFQIEQRFSLR
jgi:hypothetical protein